MILVYALVLFVEAVHGALLTGNFSIYTVPASALLFIGPAIGIYRRTNWCRIFLGFWFVLVLGFFLIMPFTGEFHFRPAYIGLLLGCALPVFLLFFYPPLKHQTQNLSQPEPNTS